MKRTMVMVALISSACGGGGFGLPSVPVDLAAEARGIAWERLSGVIVYANRGGATNPGEAQQRIYLIDVAARQVKLVRDEAVRYDTSTNCGPLGWVRELAVRPDGSTVTFSTTEDGQACNWELRDVMVANGSERVLYPTTRAHHLFPSWSRDGHLTYYSRGSDGAYTALDGRYLIDTSDDRIAWVTASTAVVSAPDPSSHQSNLYLADLTRMVLTPVFVNDQESDAQIFSSPATSPDGTKLAYERWGASVTGTEIWVSGIDGRHAVRLTSGAEDLTPAWSSDGKSVLFTRGAQGLFLADVATGEVVQVTTHEAAAMAWAP